MVNDPRFEEPPVREVALTIFFDRIPTLQSINLASLRVHWQAMYPKVSEVPPRPPLRGTRSFAEFLGSNSFWPMPFTTFTSARGDRAIQIQSDRFGIVWRFDEGPKTYPGFEALSAELSVRFDEFRQSILENLEQRVSVTHVDLEYTNEIEGMRPEQLAVGILTDWDVVSPSVANADMAGLRLHYCTIYEPRNLSLTVTVDPVPGETRQPVCSLELNVTAEVEPEDGIETTMKIGHDVLIAKFLELTSTEMKQRWGWHDERS